VDLFRYDLSGEQYIESFDYKSAYCNFEIKDDNDKIFLMSDCKEVSGYAHKRINK
jgi:hypothetical protein